MPEIKRFTFRIPSDIYEEIESIAKENRRSVTAEIIVAIEDYVKAKKSVSSKPEE